LLVAGCRPARCERNHRDDTRSADQRPLNPSELLRERPYTVHEPVGYDPQQPTPLVVLLHGRGSSGAEVRAYFGFDQVTTKRSILVAAPDGRRGKNGKTYWDAFSADENGGDRAYLEAVIDDIERRFNVDRQRVFLIGHSLGGLMAQAMACSSAARVSGIVSVSHTIARFESVCAPSRPVAVLHVHGTADETVWYQGKGLMVSVYESARIWSAKNGCENAPVEGDRLDLDVSLPGAETRLTNWTCGNAAVSLWTIEGGKHLPQFRLPEWPELLVDWLLQHPRRDPDPSNDHQRIE
jgi:polyhydroxybutyrate depolymerase